MSAFISRRTFGYATAAMAMKTGATLLVSRVMGDGLAVQGLRQALALGEATAFAQSAACAFPKAPIFTVWGAPKIAGDALFYKANTTMVGIAGNTTFINTTTPSAGLYQPDTTVIPSLGLTSWNANMLANVVGNISLAVIFANKSTKPGNHEVGSIATDMAAVGCLASYANAQTGALLPFYMSTNSTCDTSAGTFGQGNSALITNTTNSGAASAISNAVAPLQTPPQLSAQLLGDLDKLVTANTTYRATLAALGEKMAGVGPQVAAAAAIKPMNKQVTDSSDITNASALLDYNPFIYQYNLVKPLIDAGLVVAPVLSGTCPDSNAGGSFSNAGGTNTNGAQMSDTTKEACFFQFVAQVMTDYPQAVIVYAGDGGRTSNNQASGASTPGTTGGDNSVTPCILIAGAKAFTSMVYTPVQDPTQNDFTQAATVTLSNGQQMTPTTANVWSTAYKLWAGSCGSELPGFPAIKLG